MAVFVPMSDRDVVAEALGKIGGDLAVNGLIESLENQYVDITLVLR